MAIGKVTKKRVSSNVIDADVTSSKVIFQEKDASREKLSHNQKRVNHVTSEQRRREILREYYDRLVKIVPDLEESENRSEWQIYVKTKNYLHWLYTRNEQLRKHLNYFNVTCPEHLVWEYREV
ncbi:Ino4p Ecym_3542 [Eremothecium cymbalariae DBVPG|uniref:BHLH domain-containing protein n=1 Tax=Eremothecium cymbalariae (strain CBS 270.75 / DBVPG 7215 / KCTC 17166 / NRRL Y-17582) TaxID=931890 RepID=G8JQN3_ERECY|nr:Hypothetical protein Ecym_3542 [Eremothecium cymbalariae DBVPG\